MAPSFSLDSLFRHGLVTTLAILLGLGIVFLPGRGWLGPSLLTFEISSNFLRDWRILLARE